MNEEQIKELIRRTMKEELQNFMLMDRYTFQKNIQIFNKFNIQVGTDVGTEIGTSALQKIGFWGTTPVVQPATVINPTTEGGVVQDATCRERVGDIINRLQTAGIIAQDIE